MKWVVGFEVQGYGGGFAAIEGSGRSCSGIPRVGKVASAASRIGF